MKELRHFLDRFFQERIRKVDKNQQGRFQERAFLVALTLNGSLLLYEEGATHDTADEDNCDMNMSSGLFL
jgi:hypothetical protein